jgi:hypothetical protein
VSGSIFKAIANSSIADSSANIPDASGKEAIACGRATLNAPYPYPFFNYAATNNLDCFPKDHLEVQAQSLKRNIRSNLLPASSQILRSRNLNSGKV